MRSRKYTLPRHTNLAKQGSRIGAFLIDVAIGFALTLGFFFGVFNLAFRGITEPCEETLRKEDLNSGLYYADKSGEPQRIPSSKSREDFEKALKYYYFNYLPGKDIKDGLEACKDKREVTIEWFNVNILEVKADKDVAVYTMDGKDIKKEFAVPIKDVTQVELNAFIQFKYEDVILSDFNQIKYIKEIGFKQMQFNALAFTLASFIGFSISYVVLPWILKDGQSVGKKVFKIGLSNSDGYKFNNKQLIMRFMPFAVCDLSLILLVRVNIYVVLSIFMIILLVSFALAMASPKRMALHDFTSRSLVVDLQTSLLFEDSGEEEQYLLNEDKILEEGKMPVEYNGEEPELKYEKWVC